MNCNSNTMPLIDYNSQSSCNNGCSPKDINVACKTIIIPSGQEILGVKGEDNSATRYFVIPKITENGDDLSDKQFSIITLDDDGNKNIIAVDKPEILENYIKLKLIIDKNITNVEGTLKLQIEAVSENYIWKTLPASFTIANSL